MRQGIFWSKKQTKLSESDKPYKINQILMYGDLKEVRALVEEEGITKVRDVFINQPTKIYTKEAFHFVKKYILGINRDLDQTKYVKALY